jgi:hypothetical protein
MKVIKLALLLIILSGFSFAQNMNTSDKSAITPIADMKLKGLLGGVKNGKWIKDSETAKLMPENTEFVLIGENGIEEGGVSVGKKQEPDVPCEEFYPMEFDLTSDSGIAVGSNAEWNLVPRVPQKLENDSKVYKEIVKTFLAKKGLPKAKVQIQQIYRIDLDGDKQDEIVISATSYKKGVAPSASVGDYSFVMIRKVSGKKVEEILLEGDFIKKNIEFGAPNAYQISAIADLNGDGKMEVVVFGEYYEGSFSGVFELNEDKVKTVLNAGCGV